MDDRASLLAHLTRVAANTSSSSPLALRLCVALNHTLGADGSSFSVGYGSSSRTVLCSTDPLAEQIEDLQDLLREGPGLDAHRLGRPVVVRSPELVGRWPMLAQALAEAEQACALVAVPVKPDQQTLGVIVMHRTGGADFAPDLDETQFLADAIGVAVLGGFERAEPQERLWSVRDRLNQATGMVVAQLRIAPTDALAVLRAHAFAQDTSLQTIASAVLDGDLTFTSPDDPERAANDHDAD